MPTTKTTVGMFGGKVTAQVDCPETNGLHIAVVTVTFQAELPDLVYEQCEPRQIMTTMKKMTIQPTSLEVPNDARWETGRPLHASIKRIVDKRLTWPTHINATLTSVAADADGVAETFIIPLVMRPGHSQAQIRPESPRGPLPGPKHAIKCANESLRSMHADVIALNAKLRKAREELETARAALYKTRAELEQTRIITASLDCLIES